VRKTINSHTHYLLLNGEKGDAVSRGEGHEQPDQLQLLYYVDGNSYLMDTGYNQASYRHNSTWNGYNNHNVMTLNYDENIDHGGVDSPKFDATSGRKVSNENPVNDLKLEKLHGGAIYHLSGTVVIHTLHTDYRAAINHRDVLFINGDKPYVIDLNSLTNSNHDLSGFYMQYHGNGTSVWGEQNGWTSWGFPKRNTTGNRLFIYPGAVEFDVQEAPYPYGASYPKYTGEETNGIIDTLKEVVLTSYGGNHYFNTVAFLSVDSQPPAYLPYKLLPYNGSENTYQQAWAWQRDANTIDVVAKRSEINSTAYNQTFEFNLTDESGNFLTHLELPAGDDYGFARLRLQNGYWNIDSNYQINLKGKGYSYPGNVTIGTYTYPAGTDIYIGNNKTMTITGTVTFQSGTTVHLGTGSVIQTSGSGNIQATGTLFQSLSGLTDYSHRWLHILLNGNGGSTFTQCTFEGASQALYFNSTDNVDRCTFKYNSCGLYAWSGEALITGSSFVNNYDYGIFMGGTGNAWTDAYQNGSTFTATRISGSTYGVYLYDNAWAVLHYSQVDENSYGAMSYNYARLYAGDVDWSGSDQGWNRFNGNTNYAIYNTSLASDGSPWTDEARDNWWGVPSPPSGYFYGSVDYGSPLTYDPTISGAQGTSGGSGGGCPPYCSTAAPTQLQVMNNGTTNPTPAVSTSTPEPQMQQRASDRLAVIYGQLSKQPDAAGNYRLLQEAYGLIQLYDRADSSTFLNKLDSYSGRFMTSMRLATNGIAGSGQLQSSTAARSLALSKAMKRMGSTAVLLKMDHLLREKKWKHVQTLADRFAPYITQKDDKSAFLASRAVAWENQGEFAKALAAYKQIDAMQPDPAMAAHYVAPDYSFIESSLKDSMKVHSQASIAVASSGASGPSESAVDTGQQLPKKFSVGHNYPNPFNPTTIIPVSLPKAAHVKVMVYNIVGQRVATLTDREYQAGRYRLRFDAHQLASGVYFIHARLGEKTFTTQMTLIK